MWITRDTEICAERRALHFESLDGPPCAPLSHYERIVLLRAVESAAQASEQLAVADLTLAGRSELLALVRRGMHAKRRLVEWSLHDAWWYARFFTRHDRSADLELDDLMHEGMLGLFRVVERHGSEADYLFGAYVSHMMQKAMRDACTRHAHHRHRLPEAPPPV